MKISRQLMLLALVNGAALLIALLLSAYRLADLRQAFGDYSAGQATLYQLAEIKATTLAVSRADLLAPETAQQLTDADVLVRARWANLREALPAEQREAADKEVLANWDAFRKNFDNAIKIFATAPQDALSIPERIYAMYLVPLNQAVDRYTAAHQEQAMSSQASIQRHIDNLLWVVLTPLLVAGVVVLAFQIRFGQRIRKRVADMSAVSALLAQGDLQHRLPAHQADELGELAGHFNGFIEAFERILRDVQRAVADVDHVTRSVVQQSDSLDRATHDQSRQLAQTSQAIAEISRAVEEIAESATAASLSAAQASDMGEQAGQIGAATLARLEELGSAVGVAAEQLSRLSHSITQIGDVSALIKGIASQTNLLALNAAIEAARAGEHGRGFAVVADEVRALSERTATSTGRIEELLQQVWTASAEVVSSIRSAEDKAGLSRDQGGVMNQNIGSMVPAVGQVSRMLDGIAAATEQHSSSTASIVALVEQAAAIAAELERQRGRTREDMAALTAVAQSLQQTTGRFLVSAEGR